FSAPAFPAVLTYLQAAGWSFDSAPRAHTVRIDSPLFDRARVELADAPTPVICAAGPRRPPRKNRGSLGFGLPNGLHIRASGGIGRRAGFRFRWGNSWGFKSLLAHHHSTPRSGRAPRRKIGRILARPDLRPYMKRVTPTGPLSQGMLSHGGFSFVW